MEKERAIELLIQAVDEIPHLKTLHYQDGEIKLWLDKVGNILRAGLKPEDYSKYWPVSQALEILKGVYEDNIYQEEYLKKITNYEIALKSILLKYEILELEAKPSSISEPKDTAELPIYLFDKMQFHTQVVRVSRELFKDGHYRDAIYRAFVEVNNFVKLRAKSQLDGKRLMSTVFSPDNPIIKLNPLETQTDKDEQEGFMFLFMGAMQGIRNPKAHKNIIQNNPYIALKLIGFASLLMETISFWEARET